eukprot:7492687-Pyramimonas_sp.AAC.1
METRARGTCASPCSSCPLLCRSRPEGPSETRAVLRARGFCPSCCCRGLLGPGLGPVARRIVRSDPLGGSSQ